MQQRVARLKLCHVLRPHWLSPLHLSITSLTGSNMRSTDFFFLFFFLLTLMTTINVKEPGESDRNPTMPQENHSLSNFKLLGHTWQAYVIVCLNDSEARCRREMCQETTERAPSLSKGTRKKRTQTCRKCVQWTHEPRTEGAFLEAAGLHVHSGALS